MRQVRSVISFWLPTVVVLGLTLLLVLLWPSYRHRTTEATGMPEATAAYVLLGGRSYRTLPDHPLGNTWPGPKGSALSEREDIAARHLPLPQFTGLENVRAWTPAQLGAPSNTMPNLAARPVAHVLTGVPPATNGLLVTISPVLRRSGFHFTVPPGVETNVPAEARFHVELDARGNVLYLLADPCDNSAVQRLLETAINCGHGARAGNGQVQVSWGSE